MQHITHISLTKLPGFRFLEAEENQTTLRKSIQTIVNFEHKVLQAVVVQMVMATGQ